MEEKDRYNDAKKEKAFYIFGGLVASMLVAVLDCGIIIKAIVISGIIILCFCAVFFHWSKEKWVVAVLLCISFINVYCDWMIYIPYISTFSAASNKQIGFSTSQVCYVYNARNADALICSILRNKEISVYGNCEIYYRYFDLYSEQVLEFNYEQNVDFLLELQENFWDMGVMSLCSASDCFESEDIEILRNVRDNNSRLYVSAEIDRIVDESEFIAVIDSLHNIYLMTVEEWEELEIEQGI